MVFADHSVFGLVSSWLWKAQNHQNSKGILGTKYSSHKDKPIEFYKRKQWDLDTAEKKKIKKCVHSSGARTSHIMQMHSWRFTKAQMIAQDLVYEQIDPQHKSAANQLKKKKINK